MGFWKRRENQQETKEERTVPAFTAEAEPAFLNRAPVVRSSLGPETEVTGRLSFTTPTRIDGILRGEVRATELLVVGESASIDGTIRATHLIILGHVSGDVVNADRVEIGPKGTLRGSLETRALVVQEGGKLYADCRIAPTRANVRVLHAKAGAAVTTP